MSEFDHGCLNTEAELEIIHARLSARVVSVKQTLDEAEAAALRAREHAERVRRGFDNLATRRDEIKEALERLRARRTAEILDRLPHELLREVFLHCTSTPTVQNSVDLGRAAAPFRLSSVCRRWRTIVLQTSSLWGYLGFTIPYTHLQAQRLIHYGIQVESRSRNAPVEIYLNWGNVSISDSPMARHYVAIFELITGMAERWREVRIGFPTGITTDCLNMFRQVTPLLEELEVWYGCIDDDDAENVWRDEFPVYLPHCPKMRKLCTDSCHIIWTPPHVPSATLVELELFVNLPSPITWNILQCFPALEKLKLGFYDEPPEADWIPSGSPLCFLKLHTFRLFRAAHCILTSWTPHMSLPVLNTLLVDSMEVEDLYSFPSKVASTVSHVELKGVFNISEEDCTLLAPLINVKHLVIKRPYAMLSFFRGFLDTNMWPLLESIELHHTEMSEAAAGELIALVRARRSQHLKRVTLEYCSAPKWLRTNIDFFLGPTSLVS